jgi:hypothetical protein
MGVAIEPVFEMLRFAKKKIFVRPNRGPLLTPRFLIIGSQKCGTTSLYNYLIQHPNIIAALKKEIHFFDSNYDKGYEWYKSHFSATNEIKKKTDVVSGEATPYYIFHPHSPARVKKTLPRVKLIVMLRDPVERAFSHYKHHVKYNVEPLSFVEAIKMESERLNGELDKMVQDENYHSYNWQMFSYLARGVYVDQLKRWLEYFPKEQFLILQSEDFFRDPVGNFMKTLRFLGLPEYRLMSYKKFNPGEVSSMDDSVRKYLTTYFSPYNRELYELLGCDFGW